MANSEQFLCNKCGAEKGASNHWLLAWRADNGLIIRDWDPELARKGSVLVLCGDRCAVRLLSNFLTSLKWEPSVCGKRWGSLGWACTRSAEHEGMCGDMQVIEGVIGGETSAA